MTVHESSEKHRVEDATMALAAKLSTRSRHVVLFLGAGASCAAGLPSLEGLGKAVSDSLSGNARIQFEQLMEGRNVESALSRLRRIAGLLTEDDEYAGLTRLDARALDKDICQAIIQIISHSELDATAFVQLASWAGGGYYARPIEIFTVNYDTLVEQGLESARVPYFDGFVGSLRAPFRPELIEPNLDGASAMPSSFVRLWKLHGSVNWVVDTDGSFSSVVRLGAPASTDQAAIYPSDEKYDASRRVPFVVLQDHFRRSLLEPETIVLISGYSFGDQHLNELIFDAAQQRPRSDFTVCCFDSIPEVVSERASRLRNLSVLAPEEGILSGIRAPWADATEGSLQACENGRLLLGDFAAFTRFLVSATHTQVEPADE